VTDERNRQSTEIHNMLVPDLAGILLHLEAAKDGCQSRQAATTPECRGDSEEQLFVFRTLGISNPVQPDAIKPLPLEPQYVLRFGGSWHGHCETSVCMQTAFDKMNRNRGSELRTPFANARSNFQVL
jgi:hypothetical protein